MSDSVDPRGPREITHERFPPRPPRRRSLRDGEAEAAILRAEMDQLDPPDDDESDRWEAKGWGT